MGRYLLACMLAALALEAGAVRVFCQDEKPSARYPVRIVDVHVGFPYGPQNDWAKAGCWAPVLVRVGPPPLRDGSATLPADFTAELRVSTNDGDGARANFTPKAISIKREEISRERPDRAFLTYAKISSHANSVVVELANARLGGQAIDLPVFEYDKDLNGGRNYGIPNRQALIVALGRPQGLDPRANPNLEEERSDPRDYRLSTVLNLEELPDRWFGYESVDAVVLPTGGNWAGSMAQSLSADPQRRAALEQWVAQGGHLVVSVGSNANVVANRQSFPLLPLLPATIDPSAQVKSTELENLAGYLDQQVPQALRMRPKAAIKPMIVPELPKLAPTGSGYPLVSEQNGRAPVIVRGSYGLGRVTVVGFDVDREPFRSWPHNQDFWTAILDLKGAKAQGQSGFAGGMYGGERGGTYSERLGNELESFGDVAVVSFFWVAIFILAYVIIIGPVDYFLLKKVVKRLELTWITFPLMVLFVSLAAYFGAYWLKGDELRVNKVDVVDIDQTHGLTVGTTWLSVFSPRLQAYDLALEPVGVGKPREGTALSWFARDGFGFRGVEQSRNDLFQREYQLADNGAAIQGVPIQVWAMKTFTGRWAADLEGQAPILSTLRSEKSQLGGTITSRLPRELSDAWLIHKGNVYPVGALKPNVAFQVTGGGRTFSKLTPLFSPSVQTSASGQTLADYASTVGRLMYFRWFAQENQNESNELLGYLDQTRRLASEEAMLVGRLEDQSGAAVPMNDAATFGSKLKSPQLRGTLRQCTYVRVCLPVRTVGQ